MTIRLPLSPLLTSLLTALLAAAPAVADETLHNWFNDPFIQISDAVKDCPLPAGPFTDEADRRVQMHRRLEKGTTCYLARECDRPNAFAYDADIASALRAAVAERPRFPGSSLWITIQGRVLYAEGCAANEAQVAEIEAFMRALPHVQQAMAIVRTDPAARPPYKRRPAPP